MIVLPGDGIGPEVTTEAIRVLDWFCEHRDLDVVVRHEFYGAAAYVEQGAVITDEVMADLPGVDAVLFGATGEPEFDEVPLDARRRGSLLRIRRHMEVFANLRPVIGYDELADTVSLKAEAISGVDMMIVRELNGGIYFGNPRGRLGVPAQPIQNRRCAPHTAAALRRCAPPQHSSGHRRCLLHNGGGWRGGRHCKNI